MNLDAADTSLAPATGTLTVPAPTLPTAGQTATIGGTTYTFATAITAPSAADTVLIGADVASTLANLAGAINASTTNGQAAGTTYSTGTVANPLVTATSTATALNLQAINTGTGGNSAHHLDCLDCRFIRGRRPVGRRERSGGNRDSHRAASAPDRGRDGHRRGNDLHFCDRHHGPKRGQHRSDRNHRPGDPGQPGRRHQRFFDKWAGGRHHLLLGHSCQRFRHGHGFHGHRAHLASDYRWSGRQFPGYRQPVDGRLHSVARTSREAWTRCRRPRLSP